MIVNLYVYATSTSHRDANVASLSALDPYENINDFVEWGYLTIDASYLFCDNSTANTVDFGFSSPTLSAGDVVHSVRIAQRSKSDDTSYTTGVKPRLKVGGTVYTSTSYMGNTSSFSGSYYDWTTNPKSSASWTVDDINGSGSSAISDFGILLQGTDTPNKNMYCSQVYMLINYTPLLPERFGTSGGPCWGLTAFNITS